MAHVHGSKDHEIVVLITNAQMVTDPPFLAGQ